MKRINLTMECIKCKEKYYRSQRLNLLSDIDIKVPECKCGSKQKNEFKLIEFEVEE